MNFHYTAPGLDDLLLDVVTVIELSDHDREVAENRYRKLKEHLERSSSPLRELMLSSSCLIYPQGSMAIGATIISGTEDDRFDVDALIDVPIPTHWSDRKPLDELFDALQDFPDVRKIIRCTRCVQLRFAFMHFDVTMMDPAREPRPERVGEIFHSPDEGVSYRVDSNPYGFGRWFRESVEEPDKAYVEAMQSRRQQFGVNRLPSLTTLQRAEQEKLPSVIPPRVDAQQVQALKLMKRFLNLRYEDRALKRPPSIYLTKLSVTCGYEQNGLMAQLERFAQKLKAEMEAAMRAGKGPNETNPRYELDHLNDRWPTTQADRQTLADDMEYLLKALEEARDAELKGAVAVLSDLFGERIGKRSIEAFSKRMDQRQTPRSQMIERGTGAIIPATAVAAPNVVRAATEVPRHNFHSERKK